MASSTAISKLRKGTFSCWECKTRKRRCDLGSCSSRSCSWCRRRGLDCIGQDQIDPFDGNHSDTPARLDRIESLLASLKHQNRGRKHHSRLEARLAGLGNVSRIYASPDDLLQPIEAKRLRCRDLGEYMLSILPSADTIEAVTVRGRSAFRQHLGIREEWPDSTNRLICEPRYLLLAARKLYQLALCLRQMQATQEECMELGLHGSSNQVADSYVTAANHVTSQDFLVRSTQGMEVLMMQAYCRIYVGDAASMRPIFHRALTYGQLLKLDEAVDAAEEELWFRLVYAERFLSLGLGMHPFAIDDGFASDRLVATSKVTRRLERIHVLIAGNLIRRNVHMSRYSIHPTNIETDEDYEATQALDRQLKQAARSVPTSWWLLPTGNDPSHESDMNDFTHVLTGLHHYYLLLLIHQPYILGNSGRFKGCNTGYSKNASINASREILARSTFFGRFSYLPCSFVGMAQKTVAAAITLLVLHIQSQQLDRDENALEHQRPQDLCIIEANLPTIEEVFESAEMDCGYGSVYNVRRLMEIEAESWFGMPYSISMEPYTSSSLPNHDCNTTETLRIPVPYHGQIYIERTDSTTINR